MSGSKPASSVQSKGAPLPPGSVGVLRRLGVEQQPVGDGHVARRPRQDRRRGDADRLHHREAEALLHSGDPLRRLAAMQLQPVRADGLDDLGEAGIVHVDGERDDLGPAGARAQPVRRRAPA